VIPYGDIERYSDRRREMLKRASRFRLPVGIAARVEKVAGLEKKGWARIEHSQFSCRRFDEVISNGIVGNLVMNIAENGEPQFRRGGRERKIASAEDRER